jgi:hypothetical protein
MISDLVGGADRIDHMPVNCVKERSVSHGGYHETQNAEQLGSTNPIVGNDAFNQRACKMWFRI